MMNFTNKSSDSNNVNLSSHEVIPISLPVAIVFAVMSFLIGSINIVYIAVCFRVLRRKFFNLVILALCNSDAVLGLGCTLFALAPKVEIIRTNLMSCRIQVFALSFSIVSTYSLLFLLCLQRYMTVRSYNFGTKLYFDRYKYYIIGSTIAFTFTTTFGTIFFLPREYEGDYVASCNPEDLFGYFNFRIFYAIVFTPITVIILMLCILSAFTACNIYHMFFRQINRVEIVNDGKKQSEGNHSVNFGMFQARSSTQKETRNPWAKKVSKEDSDFSAINEFEENNVNTNYQVSFEMVDIRFAEDENDQNVKSSNKKKGKREKSYLEDHEGAIGKDNKKLTRKEWELRAFVTSLFVAVTAIMFTGPFVISIWLDIITGAPLPMEKKMLLFLPISLNVFSNPFLYAWRIPEIRNEFKKIYLRLRHGKTNKVDIM